MREKIDLQGGYAILTKLPTGWWQIEAYSHWDDLVPNLAMEEESREAAIALLDAEPDDEPCTCREKISAYENALEINCARLCIPVPERKPPREPSLSATRTKR